MSEKIVQLNEDVIRCKLKELVHGSIKEILNELLEAENRPGTSATSSSRATAVATTAATSPPLPEMSPSRFPNSRRFPLRQLLSSGTAAGRAAWKRLSLRCI